MTVVSTAFRDGVEEYFPPKAAPFILERLSLSKAWQEDSLPPTPQSHYQQKEHFSSTLVLMKIIS